VITGRKLALLWGCFTLLLSGCIPYKPTLMLEDSAHTIPASVSVQPLRDASPPDDKEAASRSSYAQTSASSMEEELSPLVTRAIVADFSATSVFRSIRMGQDHADLILSGTIHRFYGQVSIPSWLLIPGVGWTVKTLGSPVQEWEGEVDLELTLALPNGQALGTYRGRTDYMEIATYDNHYWSMPLYPAHARLNRAFTEAVRQILGQMMSDRDRLIASLRH
jgi:hypothetical protein